MNDSFRNLKSLVGLGVLITLSQITCLQQPNVVQAEEAPVVVEKVQVGWGNEVPLGRPVPVTVRLTGSPQTDLSVHVLATSPNGDVVRYQAKVANESSEPTATKPVRAAMVLVQVGKIGTDILLELHGPTGRIHHQRADLATSATESRLQSTILYKHSSIPAALLVNQAPPSPPWLNPSIGSAAGTDGEKTTLAQHRVRFLAAATDSLPSTVYGYAGLAAVVLTGQTLAIGEGLVPAQVEAISQWVNAGGHLILPLAITQADWANHPLAGLVPLMLKGSETTVRELSQLETYSGSPNKLQLSNRIRVCGFDLPGSTPWAASRDDRLLVTRPTGLGKVSVMALAIDEQPLASWSGTRLILERLIAGDRPREKEAIKTAGKPLSHNGITDIATQIDAVMQDLKGVPPSNLWTVSGCLLLLMLIVGPLDYFIVHKLLGRATLTWLTLPLAVIATSFLAIGIASAGRPAQLTLKQLEVVDVDTITSRANVATWLTIYAPTHRRLNVTTQEPSAEWLKVDPAADVTAVQPPTINWYGTPEEGYGGMQRLEGLQFGVGEFAAPEPGQLVGLPILSGSIKSLTTRWSGNAKPVIESSLSSTGYGRLSGKIQHNLPVPLEDWLLAYGNRVYRQTDVKGSNRIIPLQAGRVWRVEAGELRELKGFLTGSSAVKVQESSTKSAVLVEEARYDSARREPDEIIRMLTFFHDAGGETYTGLSNQLYADLDLSDELKLGRAVLLGRIKGPVGRLRIEGETAPATETITYVRFLLPVAATTTPIKDLPRLYSN